MKFAGYAAIFGQADGAKDTILPGAFRRTLAERKAPLPLYWQHRPELRIGWIKRISEDERGLRVIASIDNPDSRAAAMLTRRALDGLSFGYRARAFRNLPGGRELADIDLFEVSLVSHPLQDSARVHLIR
ncbi:HK97 family phage prohead protease [Altererythrobacter sp. MF3-039]|uniref:HK97 family phage prohead protease n=1 Tax=Altererythrobacter sp. MF3-039 TaxID=3252901 RepID=UPI00390C6422